MLKLDVNLTFLSSLTAKIFRRQYMTEKTLKWLTSLENSTKNKKLNCFNLADTCAIFSSFSQLADLFTNLLFSNVLWNFEFSIVSIFTAQGSSIFIKNQSNLSELLQNIQWWATKNLIWILSQIWIKNIDSSSSLKIQLTKKKLQLKINSIAYQQAIVCRGTFCFRVKTLSFKNLQYVAKFFWIFDKRRSKIDLFRLTREKEVKKVVRLIGH